MLNKLSRRLKTILKQPQPTIPFMRDNPAYSRFAIGEWTYGTPRVLSWNEGTTLRIGRFCSIADDVVIMLGGEHRPDWVTTYPFSAVFGEAAHFTGHPRSKGDVVIGHDVWIGRGALILSGVNIGDGAVIGAHSVVTRDVAPYAIVAGNPATFVRSRFSEHIVQRLLTLQWWNWPLEQIREAWPLLLSGRVEEFVLTYDT